MISTETTSGSGLPPFPRSEAEQELDLLKLWTAIWVRKWLILAVVVVACLAAAGVASMMTPVYRAGATLLIQDEPSKVLSIEQVYGLEGSGIDYLQTQIELLKSRALAERVVRELDLVHHPEFDPAQQPEPWLDKGSLLAWLPWLAPAEAVVPTADQVLDSVTRQFMSQINVAPQGKSQLVKVEVDMADRDTATRAANALADGHIAIQSEAAMGMSLTAASWMGGRLGELREKLLESESRLQAYREAENLVDVQGVTTISADELALTSDRMINARRQRAEAESQFRQVEAMKQGGWEKLASIPAVLGHPLSQQFRANEAQASARVDEVSRRYGPRHPMLIAAKTELAAASASLRAQVQQIIAGIERNYQLALANEHSLQASFDSSKTEIQDISRKAFKVRELEREVEGNRTLYDTFMTRWKETSATSDLQSANARVVDHATVPTAPVKPKKSMLVLVTGLLAMAACMALIWLRDALDTSVSRVEQVETQLGLAVFGIVPKMPKVERAQLVRLFTEHTNTLFSESLRTIRTRMTLAGIARPRQVLMIASSLPGEGKSVVSASIAHAFSQLERVLLVDADLRRPSLAKGFGLDVETPGLVDLVQGTGSLEQCIHKVDGLDLLCAGSASPNPLELLSSPRFAQLIEQLKSRYDRIIIDTPPIQTVSDAVVLSTFAQCLVYVIKSEATPLSEVKRGLAQLQGKQLQFTGVVLNQVDVQRAQKYGYRYSGYFDYAGYSSPLEKA